MTPVSIKPKAVVFVDFEHWYISMTKMYERKPDIKGWYTEMSGKYNVTEVCFFGDFSHPALRAEIPRIREVTNFVIETQNVSPRHKKDYTDFIMLDHIYQRAMTGNDIDTFIIFSGDGHFSSVVSFLCIKLGKNVGIYGVRDAISNQLKNSASWVIEIPTKNAENLEYYRMILRNLKRLAEVSQGKKKKQRPAFWPTVEAVSKYNDADKEKVTNVLRQMIEEGYIYQTTERLRTKTVKVLNVDWKKVDKDGIFEV
ncbi:MAG: NYN domain-containing protein [Clostridia bacterium]|nr:NYN domain-containing protein [Clostridia bacterium]